MLTIFSPSQPFSIEVLGVAVTRIQETYSDLQTALGTEILKLGTKKEHASGASIF